MSTLDPKRNRTEQNAPGGPGRRACIINPRASHHDLDALVDLVRATGARLREGAQGA